LPVDIAAILVYGTSKLHKPHSFLLLFWSRKLLIEVINIIKKNNSILKIQLNELNVLTKNVSFGWCDQFDKVPNYSSLKNMGM
jgi:hypothetical protein